MLITFKDYTEQITLEIPLARQHDVTGFLGKPSPAQLRNLCKLLFESELTESDKTIFRSFFSIPKNEDDFLSYIDRIDIDKFRPIQNFLEEKISSPSQIILEMTAILIDFEARPYSEFKKRKLEKKKTQNGVLEKPIKEPEKSIYDKYKKAGIVGLFSLGTISLGFLGINTFKTDATKANCMQWQADHFEIVDCDLTNRISLTIENPIKVYNQELYKLKKIEVNKNTTFFKEGKAVVFYLKTNDTIEFYNSPGFHPVSNKPLKPITRYMIKKYIIN